MEEIMHSFDSSFCECVCGLWHHSNNADSKSTMLMADHSGKERIVINYSNAFELLFL